MDGGGRHVPGILTAKFLHAGLKASEAGLDTLAEVAGGGAESSF
jgi:hypothetical protein